MEPRKETQVRSFSVVWAMLAVFVFSTALAMCTVKQAPQSPWQRAECRQGLCSPYGYTISLALFIVPILTYAAFFRRYVQYHLPEKWRALWTSAAFIVVLWCLLDVLLGNTFFWWPEPRATLQIFVWGYDFEKGWLRNIPIEEFVFYITGFLAILMTYIWAYNYWLRREDTKALETLETLESQPLIRWRIFTTPGNYKPVLYGAILFALAFAYKKWFSQDSEGFPGYLLFLLLLIIIPSFLLFERVRSRIQLRALVFTMQAILLTSLFWEATLALPYGWWNYHPKQMTGIFIKPWFNLPLEAPMVWLGGTWMNIIFYETVKLYYLSKRRPLAFLFGIGEKQHASPEAQESRGSA